LIWLARKRNLTRFGAGRKKSYEGVDAGQKHMPGFRIEGLVRSRPTKGGFLSGGGGGGGRERKGGKGRGRRAMVFEKISGGGKKRVFPYGERKNSCRPSRRRPHPILAGKWTAKRRSLTNFACDSEKLPLLEGALGPGERAGFQGRDEAEVRERKSWSWCRTDRASREKAFVEPHFAQEKKRRRPNRRIPGRPGGKKVSRRKTVNAGIPSLGSQGRSPETQGDVEGSEKVPAPRPPDKGGGKRDPATFFWGEGRGDGMDHFIPGGRVVRTRARQKRAADLGLILEKKKRRRGRDR